MSCDIPRMRIFAGPNGSGKSTIKLLLKPEMLGIYINPDEIEAQIREVGYLSFQNYDLQPKADEVINYFSNSTLLKRQDYRRNQLN